MKRQVKKDKFFSERNTRGNEMDRLRYGPSFFFIIVFFYCMWQSVPVRALTWCHDYTWYRVTCAYTGVNKKAPRDLRNILKKLGYLPFNYEYARQASGSYYTIRNLEKGDVFIIGEAHSGIIVDNNQRADHYIQPDGTKNIDLLPSDVEKQHSFYRNESIFDIQDRYWEFNPQTGERLPKVKFSFRELKWEIWRQVIIKVVPRRPKLDINESTHIDLVGTNLHDILLKSKRFVAEKFGKTPVEMSYANKTFGANILVREPKELLLLPSPQQVEIGDNAVFEIVAIYGENEKVGLDLVNSRKATKYEEFDVPASYGGKAANPGRVIARGKLLKVWVKPCTTQEVEPGGKAIFNIWGLYDEVGKNVERRIDHIEILADQELIRWGEKDLYRTYQNNKTIKMTVILKKSEDEENDFKSLPTGVGLGWGFGLSPINGQGGGFGKIPQKDEVVEGTELGGEDPENVGQKSLPGAGVVEEIGSGTDDTAYCPENPDELKAKCAQVNGYIRAFESQGRKAKWTASVQRAYLFRAQCCGYRWTTEGLESDTSGDTGHGFSERGQEEPRPSRSRDRQQQEALRKLRQAEQNYRNAQPFLQRQRQAQIQRQRELERQLREMGRQTTPGGYGGSTFDDGDAVILLEERASP